MYGLAASNPFVIHLISLHEVERLMIQLFLRFFHHFKYQLASNQPVCTYTLAQGMINNSYFIII
jgi:hypothetical protein